MPSLRTCTTCGRAFEPRHTRDFLCVAHQRDLRSPSHRSQRDGTGNYDRRRAVVMARATHCHWCLNPRADCKGGLTLDHVLAVADGGTHDFHNLVAACRPCNSRRAAERTNKLRGVSR